MNWSYFAAGALAAVVGWIGASLIKDADNWIGRSLGVICLWIAGIILFVGLGWVEAVGYMKEPDPDRCVQLVHLDGEWKCVPEDQAG